MRLEQTKEERNPFNTPHHKHTTTPQKIVQMESESRQLPHVHKKSKGGSTKQQRRALPPAATKSGLTTPPVNPMVLMKREVMEVFHQQERERQEQAQRDERRRDLQARVDMLQEQLQGEVLEKSRLRSMATTLRNRVETVRSVCTTLHRQRHEYEAFASASKLARNLRSPEMLAPTGLLTFAKMEGENRRGNRATPLELTSNEQAAEGSDGGGGAHKRNPPPPVMFTTAGRSSKRTAFCTDYGNQRYLGIREADAKEDLQRRIAVIIKERDDAAAATAASCCKDGEVANESAHVQRHEEYRGLSTYGYRGADSRVDLDAFKRRSSRRTKMYRDYEGKFIHMDSCDWPMTEGVNF